MISKLKEHYSFKIKNDCSRVWKISGNARGLLANLNGISKEDFLEEGKVEQRFEEEQVIHKLISVEKWEGTW